MSVLRVFRNLAVLVILAAGLSLSPRPLAAQSCRPLGAVCNYTLTCCPGSLCGPALRCCNKPFRSMMCTRSDVCCQGICYFFPGKSYGRCS
jgi:hypothetical protein